MHRQVTTSAYGPGATNTQVTSRHTWPCQISLGESAVRYRIQPPSTIATSDAASVIQIQVDTSLVAPSLGNIGRSIRSDSLRNRALVRASSRTGSPVPAAVGQDPRARAAAAGD